QRDRRQPGEGQRRHGCVDVCARSLLARSQLEAGRHRSRAMSRPERPAASACAFAFAAALIALAPAADAEPLSLPETQLEPVRWSDLAGWAADDHLAAFAAFQASCRGLRHKRASADDRPIFAALAQVCRRLALPRPRDASAARMF